MPTDPQPAVGGWHPIEWTCEFLGTALLLLGGLSAVCLDFGPSSPFAGLGNSPRLLLTGVMFAGTGSLIAVSPLGRRSGAHLNPVVTLAFWTQRKVHRHDLAGYVLSQLTGAILGTLLVAALWGADATALNLGTTAPGPGTSDTAALLIETLMTATLVATILLMTSSARSARWDASRAVAADRRTDVARRSVHRHQPQPRTKPRTRSARTPRDAVLDLQPRTLLGGGPSPCPATRC